MMRKSITLLYGAVLSVSLLGAQEGVEKGTIKKVDADKGTVTITVGDKDREFAANASTKFKDAGFKDIDDGLKDARFKTGVKVMFKATNNGVLLGMKIDGSEPPLPQVDTSKLKPLTDLGNERYEGFTGGLYPGGKNERPAAHEAAGVALARLVRPLDKEGQPSKTGKIVLLSVGMSNTGQASEGLAKALAGFGDRNPHLMFVNGADGGMTAFIIQNANDGKQGTEYWKKVNKKLQAAEVSSAQVQAIWIKEADAGPSEGFPGYAKKLEAELTKVVQLLPGRFPNLKLVYLSSRTYGGYATTKLNPEPYAYESGFAVKWLIEKQIDGDAALNFDPTKGAVKAPWLSWGPYLWANGSTKRNDGFCYDRADFSPKDGTHLTNSGVTKVGNLLLNFFKSDATSRPWFVAANG